MPEPNVLADLQRLLLSLGLGLLVGLERQRAGKEVGLRTFSFTSLAGTLAWLLQAAAAPWIMLGFVTVMVIVINARALQLGHGPEATTSVALFVTALNGILVARGDLFVPVAVVVLMMLMLAWKDEMVGFTEAISRDEIHAAITLGLLAFVVLPVLPAGPIDPWRLLDLRQIWLMVVLLSAIGFGNYVLLKLYGARGVTYSGFLGGLVNSTATMTEMALKVRQDARLADYAFKGIMLAKAAMFLRNFVVLGIFAPSALPNAAGPIGLAMVTALALAWRGTRLRPEATPQIAVSSPFSLRAALEFGAVFLALSIAGGLAARAFGESALFAVSFVAGLVSSSSLAASAANLASLGEISLRAAGLAVVISSLASNFVSVPLVWRSSGDAALVRRVIAATLFVAAAAAAGWLLTLQLAAPTV